MNGQRKVGPPKVEERLQVFPSSMSFLLTVGFLKVGNQPITGNAQGMKRTVGRGVSYAILSSTGH